jgi:sporulation protein YlmC with PRC-barrel domain
MNIVRDVLDKLAVDRNGQEMGRVDGIVLEAQEGQPPRLSAIVIGPTALGSRLHPGVGRFISRLEERFGLSKDRPVRIEFDGLTVGDRKVTIRRTISETSADEVEQRLRAWIVGLPGSR